MTERIYYDGGCGLCHRMVRFVLRHDSDGSTFRFAALSGRTFLERIQEERRAGLPDSLLVERADGELLLKSAAVAHVLMRLGGPWRLAAALLRAVPRPLRDAGYDLLARVRARLFRNPSGVCPVGDPETRRRFDP